MLLCEDLKLNKMFEKTKRLRGRGRGSGRRRRRKSAWGKHTTENRKGGNQEQRHPPDLT